MVEDVILSFMSRVSFDSVVWERRQDHESKQQMHLQIDKLMFSRHTIKSETSTFCISKTATTDYFCLILRCNIQTIFLSLSVHLNEHGYLYHTTSDDFTADEVLRFPMSGNCLKLSWLVKGCWLLGISCECLCSHILDSYLGRFLKVELLIFQSGKGRYNSIGGKPNQSNKRPI